MATLLLKAHSIRAVARYFGGLVALVFSTQSIATDYDVPTQFNLWVGGTGIRTLIASADGYGFLQQGRGTITIGRNDSQPYPASERYRICLDSITACVELGRVTVAAGALTSNPVPFVLPASFTTGSRSVVVQRVDSVSGNPDPAVYGVAHTVTALGSSFTATGQSALMVAVGGVASGGSYACALTTAAEVYCWGSAGSALGQADGLRRAVPTRVEGLPPIRKIAASQGGGGTCALSTTGAVFCWGRTTQIPTQIGITDAIDVDVSSYAVCAVRTNHAVSCVGSNQYGSLGVPQATAMSTSVPLVASAVGYEATSVHVARPNVCVTTTTPSVRCWGWGQSGQAGDGSPSSSTLLYPATTPSGLAGYEVGDSKSDQWCAVSPTGLAKCWGYTYPLTGLPGIGSAALTPTPTSALSGSYSRIATRTNGGCALSTGGSLSCWGTNDFGQVGDGSAVLRPDGTAVSGLPSTVQAFAVGDEMTCAVLSGGNVKCWGKEFLGNGLSTGSPTPVSVFGFGVTTIIPAPSVSALQRSGDQATFTVADGQSASGGTVNQYRAACRMVGKSLPSVFFTVNVSEPLGTTHSWPVALPRASTTGWECSVGYSTTVGVSGLSAYLRVGVDPVNAPAIVSSSFDGTTARITYSDTTPASEGPIIARSGFCTDGNSTVSPTEFYEHPAGTQSTVVFGPLTHQTTPTNPWSCNVSVSTQGGKSPASSSFTPTSSITTAPTILFARLTGNTGIIEFADNQATTTTVANALWTCTGSGTTSGSVAIGAQGGGRARITFPLASSDGIQNPNTYNCTVAISPSGTLWGPSSAAVQMRPNQPPLVSGVSFSVASGRISGSFSVQDPDGDSLKNFSVHVGKTFPGNDCASPILGSAEAAIAGGTYSFTIDNNELCTLMLATSGTLYAWIEGYDVFDSQASVTTGFFDYTAPAPSFVPNAAGQTFVAETIPTMLRVNESADIHIKLVDSTNSVITSFRGPVRVGVDVYGLAWGMDPPSNATVTASSERVVWFQNGRGTIKGFRVHAPAVVRIVLASNIDALNPALVIGTANTSELKEATTITGTGATLGPITVGSVPSARVKVTFSDLVRNSRVNAFVSGLGAGNYVANLVPRAGGASITATANTLTGTPFIFATVSNDLYRVEFRDTTTNQVMVAPVDVYVDASQGSVQKSVSGNHYLPFDRRGLRPVLLLPGVFGSSIDNELFRFFPKVPTNLCMPASSEFTGWNQPACAQWDFLTIGSGWADKFHQGLGWANLFAELEAANYAVVPVAYDFRLPAPDIAARYLAPAIQRARTISRSAQGTNLPLDIVAHSMGGIVAAYHLASPANTGGIVDRLIAVGTPYGGSYNAIGLMRAADPMGTDCALMTSASDFDTYCTQRQSTYTDSLKRIYTSIVESIFRDMGRGELLEEFTVQGQKRVKYRTGSTSASRAKVINYAAPSGWYLYPRALWNNIPGGGLSLLDRSTLRQRTVCVAASVPPSGALSADAQAKVIGLYSNTERTLTGLGTQNPSAFTTFSDFRPVLSASGAGDGTVPQSLTREAYAFYWGSNTNASRPVCVTEGNYGSHAMMINSQVTRSAISAALSGLALPVSLAPAKATELSQATPSLTVITSFSGLSLATPASGTVSWIEGIESNAIGAEVSGSMHGTSIAISSPSTGRYVLTPQFPTNGSMLDLGATLFDGAQTSKQFGLRLLRSAGSVYLDVNASNIANSGVSTDGPQQVDQIAVRALQSGLQILWTAVPNAARYEVLARSAGSSIWTMIGTANSANATSVVIPDVRLQSATHPLLEIAVLAVNAGGYYSPVGATAYNVETTDPALDFGSRSNVPISSLQTSATLSGSNTTPLRFTISGGEYSLDGGAWTSAAGVLSVGSTIAVRTTAPSASASTSAATLTFANGYVARFVVSTALVCSLDVSGDGRFDWVDATLIARALLSFSSDALTTGLFSPPLTPPQSAAIADRIALLVGSGTFDLDGDGQTLASTDGALLTRLASGQSGTTAVNNLLSSVGSRPSWPLIRDYVNATCGTALQ